MAQPHCPLTVSDTASQMARATATTLSPSNGRAPTGLFRSSILQPPFLSLPLQSLHHGHHTGRWQKDRIVVCRGKLDGLTGEEPEEIDEVFFDGDDEVEDESDDDETESSVELLIRFLQSMFKKVSRRAKKASRSVLPIAISPQLVSFAVDGILLLASLSIVKAFLEVVCTLGGTVFVVILLLRVVWAGIFYFQSTGNSFGQDRGSFDATQPVT